MFLLSFLSSPWILTSRKILDQFQRFNFVQDKSFQPGALGVPPCDSIITTGG